MQITNPCQVCQDYTSRIEGCVNAMLKGNYNGFTGLGILIDMLDEEEFYLNPPEGISSVCRERGRAGSIYRPDFVENIRKTYEEIKKGMEKPGNTDDISEIATKVVGIRLEKPQADDPFVLLRIRMLVLPK